MTFVVDIVELGGFFFRYPSLEISVAFHQFSALVFNFRAVLNRRTNGWGLVIFQQGVVLSEFGSIKKEKLTISQGVGRDNSVGRATCYGLEGPRSNPGGDEFFRTLSDWPCLLHSGHRIIPGSKENVAWC